MIFHRTHIHHILDSYLDDWIRDHPGLTPFTSIKIFPFDEKKMMKKAYKISVIKNKIDKIKRTTLNEHKQLGELKTPSKVKWVKVETVSSEIIEKKVDLQGEMTFDINSYDNVELTPFTVISTNKTKLIQKDSVLFTELEDKQIIAKEDSVDLKINVASVEYALEKLSAGVPIIIQNPDKKIKIYNNNNEMICECLIPYADLKIDVRKIRKTDRLTLFPEIMLLHNTFGMLMNQMGNEMIDKISRILNSIDNLLELKPLVLMNFENG